MATPAPVVDLLVRLVLDGQAEFRRVAAAIPPGDTPAGQNDPAWVVAHTAFIHDVWITQIVGQREPTPAARAWASSAPGGATPGTVPPPPASMAEALGLLDAVCARTTAVLQGLDEAALRRVCAVPPPFEPVAAGYLVARAPAHLFTHAGELSLILTARGGAEPGLPGALDHVAGWMPAAGI